MIINKHKFNPAVAHNCKDKKITAVKQQIKNHQAQTL